MSLLQNVRVIGFRNQLVMEVAFIVEEQDYRAILTKDGYGWRVKDFFVPATSLANKEDGTYRKTFTKQRTSTEKKLFILSQQLLVDPVVINYKQELMTAK